MFNVGFLLNEPSLIVEKLFILNRPSWLWVVAWILLLGCKEQGQTNEINNQVASIDTGRQLMLHYCGRCHLTVEPGMLDKKSWTDYVLPAMATKMGIKVWGKNQYYAAVDKQESDISFNNWLKLVAYYKDHSPDTLKSAKVGVPLLKDWFVFHLKKPVVQTTGKASTLMVAFDTINNNIYTCDENNDLYQWNSQLKVTTVDRIASPAVSMQIIKEPDDSIKNVFTLIGTMQALDNPSGTLIAYNSGSKSEVLADKLPRPVQAVPVDFNKDGLRDWLICGFGHNYGGLYLLQQSAGKKFTKKVIREVPGSLQAITGDFNHDGWQDIICLFAHAEEGIWLFTNDHQGNFVTKNLLRFNPAFGSTSIQLADFNNDGLLDIVYTCGDNSDYSRILKPFHGVYIFLNEGNDKYKQAWFYPVNGCTKVLVADFNMDGKTDIAMIAFFADLKNNPSEKIICFQQDRPLHFIPHYLPIESYGRWICMDVNDYDHDGDPDIILGNYSKGFINQQNFEPDWDIHLPFVILENTTSSYNSRLKKQHVKYGGR